MNIFVANLDFSVQSDDLRDLFETYGEVDSAKVIMDRDTGRSRGFAFVEMTNDEDGRKAIDELNDSEISGRRIVVKQAEDRERRGGGGGRGGYGGGGGRGGYGGGGGRGGYDRGGRGGGGYGSRY